MFSDPQENISKLELEEGMKVVDIGAGSGHHALLIARTVGASGEVIAVDVQKDLLSKLQKEAKLEHLVNMTIVHANAEKLGGTRLRDGLADRVFLSNILFQIEDQENFVKEVKRILRRGGKVVLIDWEKGFGHEEHEKMIVGPLEAIHLFTREGFEKESEFNPGDEHYGIIFKKPNA